MRAVIYARFSTDKQSEDPIEAQERACPYASVPSLTIVRWGGEDLWTLAKRYCSSERLIRETNGLTDDAAMAEAPQYLLIPKTQA